MPEIATERSMMRAAVLTILKLTDRSIRTWAKDESAAKERRTAVFFLSGYVATWLRESNLYLVFRTDHSLDLPFEYLFPQPSPHAATRDRLCLRPFYPPPDAGADKSTCPQALLLILIWVVWHVCYEFFKVKRKLTRAQKSLDKHTR